MLTSEQGHTIIGILNTRLSLYHCRKRKTLKAEQRLADITQPLEPRPERLSMAASGAFESVIKSQPQRTAQVTRGSSAIVLLLMLSSLIYMFQYLYRRDAHHTKAENEFILALEAQQTSLQNSIQALTLLDREVEAVGHGNESEAQIRQLKLDMRKVTGLLHEQVIAQQEIVSRLLESVRAQAK